jgi:hypothetical protein
MASKKTVKKDDDLFDTAEKAHGFDINDTDKE